jgi:predicted ATP-grasp superfamily ATP-dependent carboligase
LGVTRQLIGQPTLGGRAFQYVGSIGPLKLTPDQQQQWHHLGDCLSAQFRLRGLFGVDAIDTGQAIVPVEVNPRYTASIEVLERSLGWPIVAWHIQACRAARLPEPTCPTSVVCSGKAIVYATNRCRWTGHSATLQAAAEAKDAWPPWADIPPRDSQFESGWPVLTVLAEGPGVSEVQSRLYELAQQVRSDWLTSL